MISLVYPSDQATRYLFQFGIALGPFNSVFDFDAENIVFDSTLRAMTSKVGIYGENHVEHDKLTGDIEYVPLSGKCLPFPTAQYPMQTKVPVKGYTGGYYTANFGLAVNRSNTWGYTGSTRTQALNYACWRDETTKRWHLIKVQNAASDPTCVNGIIHYEILSVVPYSGALHKVSLKVDTRQGLGTGGVKTSLNWLQKRTYEEILAIYSSPPGTYWTSSASSSYSNVYEADLSPSDILYPQTAKQKIDSLVAYWLPGTFPVPDKHYGDLAMEASAKVNANHVNMIAFLRDLRHPTEMIPKLKNLRNLKNLVSKKALKNLSDDYLTVKYGILPTISDLKEIFGAMNALLPYVDRNGFDTYSAGYIASSTPDKVTYKVEQHIKLAIVDEDSDFLRLISQIDDLGFLPTCENLWDLVPYSFVIDWFVDVGGLLERVDAALRIVRLNIKYVTMSRKTTICGTFPADGNAPFWGSIEWVHYHRWVSDQCPVPPLTLQLNPSDFNHWLEAGALLAQRS